MRVQVSFCSGHFQPRLVSSRHDKFFVQLEKYYQRNTGVIFYDKIWRQNFLWILNEDFERFDSNSELYINLCNYRQSKTETDFTTTFYDLPEFEHCFCLLFDHEVSSFITNLTESNNQLMSACSRDISMSLNWVYTVKMQANISFLKASSKSISIQNCILSVTQLA